MIHQKQFRQGHHFGGTPAESPTYFIAEAAHYLGLPVRTVRDWCVGREYSTSKGLVHSRPLVKMADPKRQILSFLNLVELHVIGSIRRVHRVHPKSLRRAIDYLQSSFDTDHPLLHRQMLTDGKRLFIERYGQLQDISSDGQLHMRQALEAHLKRIEWDERHVSIRLFPFTRPTMENSPQLVAINPRVRSGRPCIAGTGVPTSIIAERHKAGDSVELLTKDYGRSLEEIEEALRYESRAAS